MDTERAKPPWDLTADADPHGLCLTHAASPSAETTYLIRADRRDDSPLETSAALVHLATEHVASTQPPYASRDERQRLSALLVSIQEDERKRIALDLHDGLGQCLTLIKLSIEKSDVLLAAGATGEARASLQQLMPRVKEAMSEVRRVATDLRPSILDDLGLLPTLSWFFREFRAACGNIVVDTAFNVTEHDIPAPLHITLYRILQEATHNIIKHAAADRVHVRLDRMDDVLHLLIEDNGRGFAPDSVTYIPGQTRGLGLISMKERASFSGGAYQLRSGPGQGTAIWVAWPCGTFRGATSASQRDN